jgi:predicted nucleic acid-binding Zn ribbon protein
MAEERSVPGARLAQEALARARQAASAARLASERTVATRRRSQIREANAAQVRERASESTGTEPVAFGAAIEQLLADRGWAADLREARVTADWPAMVGPELASHSRPVSLREGVLTVEAESTAWATQIRLLQRQVLTTIKQAVGSGVVSSLVVRGPAGPSWRHGRLRAPGPGPRDTYG